MRIRALELGVVLLIVATALGGVWLLTQPRRSTATAGPSGSPDVASAVASPRSTPAPTPRAIPDDIRIIDAFFERIDDPKLSYHLSARGSVVGSFIRQRFTLELNVKGDDYAGRVNTIGGSGKARLVRKKGVVYAKPAGDRWHKRRTDSPVLRQVPFMAVDGRNDIEYVRSFKEGGRTLHRLVTTKYYQPNVARLLDLSRFSAVPDVLKVTFVVTDTGRPLRASVRVEKGKRGKGQQYVVGKATYRFTKWGADFTIKKPT
jgi:hypothetical protein